MRIKICRAANQDAARRRGRFAHSLHVPGAICVCAGFYELPPGHRAGILAHEVGHTLLVLAEGHTESDASWAGAYVLDIQLRSRQTRRWGRVLWTSPQALPRIMKLIAALPDDEHGLVVLLRHALLGARGGPSAPTAQADASDP